MPIDDDIRPHLLGDALRRRWWLVGLMALILGSAASATSILGSDSYTSTTSVFLKPLNGNALDSNATSNGQQITIAMETEASLVTSPGVTKLVSKQLASRVRPGAPSVSTSVPTNTQIVQISYTAASPEGARDGARAFAASFLQFRQDSSASSQSAQLKALRGQADEVRAKLREATAAAKKENAPTDARSRVEIYTTRLSTLQDSIGSAEVTRGSPGFVVTPANRPGEADGLSPTLLALVGGIAGLAAGAGLAIWLERRDDRIRADSDIDINGIPILATVPTAEAPRLAADAGALARDAYRRARIATVARCQEKSKILVCELEAATGRAAEVATNLALSMAAAGHRTVVVETGSNGVSELLGIDDDASLAVALSGGEVPQPLPERCGVSVLLGSSGAEEQPKPWADAEVRRVLHDLDERYEFVFVVGSPASTADMDAAALDCDGVLLVVNDHVTTHNEVTTWVERKKWLGVDVVGAICTSLERASGLHRRPMGTSPRRGGATSQPSPEGATPPARDGSPLTPSGVPQ